MLSAVIASTPLGPGCESCVLLAFVGRRCENRRIAPVSARTPDMPLVIDIFYISQT